MGLLDDTIFDASRPLPNSRIRRKSMDDIELSEEELPDPSGMETVFRRHEASCECQRREKRTVPVRRSWTTTGRTELAVLPGADSKPQHQLSAEQFSIRRSAAADGSSTMLVGPDVVVLNSSEHSDAEQAKDLQAAASASDPIRAEGPWRAGQVESDGLHVHAVSVSTVSHEHATNYGTDGLDGQEKMQDMLHPLQTSLVDSDKHSSEVLAPQRPVPPSRGTATATAIPSFRNSEQGLDRHPVQGEGQTHLAIGRIDVVVVAKDQQPLVKTVAAERGNNGFVSRNYLKRL